MGYQALLFCPDEKTARTVTQVLSELEFSVESCIEPFAAVKKLMGQHFDAVVVDCDNEQNATLLFKSARNSSSNQTSLAVAVVEGQAGVAKAFRIGANLVLTKPINIEQAKGTLRVARGLLRKGDPARPAAPAPAPLPAKPVASKPVPVPPLKPAQVPPAAVSAPLSAAPPEIKPVPAQAWPAAAAALSAPAAEDDNLLDIGAENTVTTPPPTMVQASSRQIVIPESQSVAPPAVSAAPAAAEPKIAFSVSPGPHGSGAASAPAPAREAQNSPAVESAPASKPAEAAAVSDKLAEPATSATSSYAGSAPSFTFGGANAPEEATGGSKKIFIGIAAVALVAGALYLGWSKFQGHSSEPTTAPSQTAPAPVAAPQIPKPSAKAEPTIPATSAPAAAASASLPSSQPEAVAAKSQPKDNSSDASDDDTSASNSTKHASSASSASNPAAEPLVLKGGKVPVLQAKPAAADAPAPSMIGIEAAAGGAPPPDLGGAASAPAPVLQTLNVSQGVSQGLLTKKVQPIYPRNALTMHVEGSVELQATISKTGDISKVKVLSGDGLLAKAASDAVKQWKYKPYLLNGEPVEIQTEVTINFKLPK
jgi:TonB family protein